MRDKETVHANISQVLLINFSEDDLKQVTAAGFRADLGYASYGINGSYFNAPHPVHEYDFYVYNSAGTRNANRATKGIELSGNTKFFHELCDLNTLPFVRIAFIGEVPNYAQDLIGTEHVRVVDAHENASIVLPVPSGSECVPKLDELLKQLVGQVKLPVQQYLSYTEEAVTHPYRLKTAYTNRNGNILAAYSTSYGRALPFYVALPQFKNNAAVLIKLLHLFSELSPEVFPQLAQSGWESSREFWFPEEARIQEEIVQKQKETELFVANKHNEFVKAGQEFSYIRGILTALETPDLPKDERLSVQVKKVLSFLGFDVTDIDEKVKTAIRKEDLWIQDEDGFLAIGEINGTQKKNPKRTEYNDLLGRMNTIFKRRDLVPNPQNISGLLILNYDSKTHPDQRPALYSGDDADIPKAAPESEIGILSTTELYKLARAVVSGELTREEARTQIKRFGLIKAELPISTKSKKR